MDGNAQFVKQARVERTLKALAKNRIPAVFVPTCQEAVQAVKELLSPGDVVSCGGSMTLEECGVRRATHLVAATGDDASNLLIAELASEIFGVPHVLPLVDDDALADILDDMGIAPICPHRICEDEFFRLTGLTRKEADL